MILPQGAGYGSDCVGDGQVKEMRMIIIKSNIIFIDDIDYYTLISHSWHLEEGYARAYINKDGKKGNVYMHRLILQPTADQQVDHIDGNKLNNQRSNLRLCTHQQNQMNRPVQKNSLTGIKGVSFNKKSGQWQARIKKERVSHYLGMFKSASEAKMVYDLASKKLFGDFSRS